MAKLTESYYYKKIHANCGGEIEYLALANSIRTLVRCKKCGKKEFNFKIKLPEHLSGVLDDQEEFKIPDYAKK